MLWTEGLIGLMGEAATVGAEFIGFVGGSTDWGVHRIHRRAAASRGCTDDKDHALERMGMGGGAAAKGMKHVVWVHWLGRMPFSGGAGAKKIIQRGPII